MMESSGDLRLCFEAARLRNSVGVANLEEIIDEIMGNLIGIGDK